MTSTSSSAETPRLALLREQRKAARSHRLAQLLEQRPDLAGVHAPADWALDAVRWSA